jgi:ABC-type nitrate/sulfonate/bicarbonate transport system ATPase subunit
MRQELVTLVDSGPVSTLLVTHDLEEAARLADRIFVLSARPARILAEVAIRTPRARRTEPEIAGIKSRLLRQNAADNPVTPA